ncbi:hypothetical protein Tco_0522930 [Tanacetum coccineum]
MIDELSIVETDKVIHTVETDMMKVVVEIECFGVNFDEFDKETGSSDELQPKQAGLNCVHALNEPHLHEIHVVPNKHEADRSLGLLLEEIHVTWAHLEKKRTRLQLHTKSLEENAYSGWRRRHILS